MSSGPVISNKVGLGSLAIPAVEKATEKSATTREAISNVSKLEGVPRSTDDRLKQYASVLGFQIGGASQEQGKSSFSASQALAREGGSTFGIAAGTADPLKQLPSASACYELARRALRG